MTFLCFHEDGVGQRPMLQFYFDYETIEEERESKLSSQGDIRTDLSNSDESFVHDVIDICDEPGDKDDNQEGADLVMTRARSISQPQGIQSNGQARVQLPQPRVQETEFNNDLETEDNQLRDSEQKIATNESTGQHTAEKQKR